MAQDSGKNHNSPAGDLMVTGATGAWRAIFGDRVWRCALGRSGVVRDKREGDLATPAGCWPLRRVLYRPDRLSAPETVLATAPLMPEDAWCDDPQDPRYNQPVTRPCSASHERLWRDDGLYDVIVILGHNDAPAVSGHGSAIFLHVARPDYGPTLGCIALALPDLLTLLRQVAATSRVCIKDAGMTKA